MANAVLALARSDHSDCEKRALPPYGCATEEGMWDSRTRFRGTSKDDIGKLAVPLQTLLVCKGIPWVAQSCLGKEGYVTLEDLAYRWDSPEDCRKQSPDELGFKGAPPQIRCHAHDAGSTPGPGRCLRPRRLTKESSPARAARSRTTSRPFVTGSNCRRIGRRALVADRPS